MSLLINPGSGPIAEGEGWSNTYDQAKATALEWLGRMRADGLADIELLPGNPECAEGRWRFEFRHKVTGVVVALETHGLTDFDAYVKEHLFAPRVYWAGSSCSEPELSDWAADGFTAVKTFIADG